MNSIVYLVESPQVMHIHSSVTGQLTQLTCHASMTIASQKRERERVSEQRGRDGEKKVETSRKMERKNWEKTEE